MNSSFSDRARQFVHAFIIEQAVILVYWMFVIKLDTKQICTIYNALWGVVLSTAILLIIKLTFDILFHAIEQFPRQQKRQTKWIIVLVYLFDSAAASYCGWTIFSIITNTFISSRTMVIVCLMTLSGMIMLNLMIEYLLGYLPSKVVSQITKTKRLIMTHGDTDIDQ